MADTRDQQRTQTAGADMRDGSMPQGQAPAARQPNMTAVQRAAAERQARYSTFIAAATLNQASIERSLKHHGISFDFFMAALDVGLKNTMKNDEKFFEVVSPQSFLEAVLRATHLGLLPDGKEGAIVRFKDEAAFLAMAEGFVKILWATGVVVEINHNVVCEGDDFDFQEGDSGYVTHRRSLKRASNAETIGAWCVVKLATGGTLIEVCDQADLQKMAAVSRAQKGPRFDWAREMHRKGPFRRIVKRMPKTSRLSELIGHDDTAYDLARVSSAAAEGVRRAIPNKALFADTRHQEPDDEVNDEDGQASSDRSEGNAAQDAQAGDGQDSQGQMDDETSPGAGDALEAEGQAGEDDVDIVIDDPAYVQRLRFRIESNDDVEAFWEVMDTVFEGSDNRLSSNTREILNTLADAHGKLLDGGPLLRAWTTSTQKEPKVYQDGNEWASAILEKLGAIKSHKDQLRAFWAKNVDLVRRAEKYDIGAVRRVREAAAKHGLET